MHSNMNTLYNEIRQCKVCLPELEHGVNPILSATAKSRFAIIGRAPGSVVHRTSIPWDDKSGERLRSWLGVDIDTFYNPDIFAIIPMGFCYPGRGKSGIFLHVKNAHHSGIKKCLIASPISN